MQQTMKKPKTSAMSKIYVLVEGHENHDIQGRLFTCKGEMTFGNIHEMLFRMEETYDQLAMPQKVFLQRRFSKQPLKNDDCSKVRSLQMDRELCSPEQEEKATFVIHVKFRQNATWQGEIKWVDRGETQHFRSDLEMMKLMDEALSQTFGEKDQVKWNGAEKNK